LEHSNNEI